MFVGGGRELPDGRNRSGVSAVSGPALPPPPPGAQPPVGPPWLGAHGQAPYPQQPPGPWPQPGPPPGPPRGSQRWLLLALAFLAVIAVSVAATVWFTHRGSGNQAGPAGGSSQSSSGEIASANDTGPVGIITEDPTCDRWVSIQNEVAAKLKDWSGRDPSIPAAAWTSEQRQMHESAARVLRAQADQTIPLARETPHRVMRELFEQQIAYSRAYADALPTYIPAENALALVGNDIAAGLISICGAIKNFAAVDRAASVPQAAPPTDIAQSGDPASPNKFLAAPSPACPALASRADQESLELASWFKTDPDVPAAQRSSADKVLWDMAAQVLARSAEKIEAIGRSSGNPTVEDFLVLSAQYYRAFVNAIPTSTGADAKLYDVAQKIQVSVYAACKAVQA